jgi:hypothetical protein
MKQELKQVLKLAPPNNNKTITTTTTTTTTTITTTTTTTTKPQHIGLTLLSLVKLKGAFWTILAGKRTLDFDKLTPSTFTAIDGFFICSKISRLAIKTTKF